MAGLAGVLLVQVADSHLGVLAERIDKISVFGGLDSVLNSLVKLR